MYHVQLLMGLCIVWGDKSVIIGYLKTEEVEDVKSSTVFERKKA